MSTSRLLKKEEYEAAIDLGVRQIQKGRRVADNKRTVVAAYSSFTARALLTAELAQKSNEPFKWAKTLEAYQKINKIYQQIAVLSDHDTWITLLDKSQEITNVREAAAQEYYDAAIRALQRTGSRDALQAFDFLQQANRIKPGFRDVPELLARVQQLDSFRVFSPRLTYLKEREEEEPPKRLVAGPHLAVGLNNYVAANPPYTLRVLPSIYAEVGLLAAVRMTSLKRRLIFITSASWYNFRFADDQITLINNGQKPVFISHTYSDPALSKFTVAHANIKVHYWFTGKNRLFDYEMMCGPYFGYRVASYTKIGFKPSSNQSPVKVEDPFFLSRARYGVFFSFVIDKIGFFFTMDVNPLFERNQEPTLYPFVIGLSFSKRKSYLR